jgi:membrane-associated protein
MHSLLDVYHSLTDPDSLIRLLTQVITGWLGYALLAGVVFAETGLLLGLFLPGDSLLFTVGVVAGAGDLDIVRICALLTVVSILGDQSGYLLGYRTGPRIFRRKDSLLFKQEYVTRTQAFYEKHGGKTLIYAKFVPIVRTFAPFMAGVGRMRYSRFLSFNVFGGIGWVLSMTLAGFALGDVAVVRRNFEKVVIGIVLVSVLPMVVQVLKSRKEASAARVASLADVSE